jgi:hypothetical protein
LVDEHKQKLPKQGHIVAQASAAKLRDIDVRSSHPTGAEVLNSKISNRLAAITVNRPSMLSFGDAWLL